MISYGEMLDVVEKEEVKNAPVDTPTTPTVETPQEAEKKEKDEDNIIEDVIGEKKEDENIEN